ncbi:thiamine pyrophosphate-dependent enzyme [Thermodesulforhabdus norvegica]|uniref:Indolepyruvate oxidoreductase subunit IorA n=1 Tax=Thermodesulforhabdus norvegica TaxID=39841 RepID=A0A1I4TYR6_9BACT|nr:thiamine pyrophosphate-dependent enzyme [Thermodesulforhabdus norvegica]SFM81956.1 indolepyruvate ferredoxin oxidoreductase alpha subunit [Thermodesulforhabdus norvegica]
MSERKILLGNEAIAYALVASGCHVVASYPGTPASEILQSILNLKQKHGIGDLYAEWSINEKVAFETALAAAYSGLRAAASMKQVGLNVASDALMSAAYTGVAGGFIVISADDPGPHSSQTEQDSRFFAMFAKIPVFDPSSPHEATECIASAFELSERYQIPVMVRPTTRVCHARQDVPLPGFKRLKREPRFEKNPQRWAATPKFRYLLHKKLNEKMENISRENLISLPENPKPACVIASGVVWAHLREIVEDLNLTDRLDLVKITMAYPISQSFLREIQNRYERILVLEETYPVIEVQFPCRDRVSGRLDGTVPSEGELLPEKVEEIVRRWCDLTPSPSFHLPSKKQDRRPTLCPGCGHRPVFFAIRKVFPGGIYPGDIGCYTLGLNLGAVDTVLCMGASVAQAAGFSRVFSLFGDQKEGVPVIATIGDSTFFHAGIPPLINAVSGGARFILVIVDNGTTAMTGHQPTPDISIERMVEACGVGFIRVVDPYELSELMEALKEAGKYAFEDELGVAVVIARRPCIMNRKQDRGFDPVVVEVTDECTGCQLCVDRFECPAILSRGKKEKVEIDRVLCTGCGVCVQVCPYGGLRVAGLDEV